MNLRNIVLKNIGICNYTINIFTLENPNNYHLKEKPFN